LPPLWAIATQSGNLNFLEPSGYLGPVMGLTLPITAGFPKGLFFPNSLKANYKKIK